MRNTDRENLFDELEIKTSVAHRWSAAFPIVQPSDGITSTGSCYLNFEARFAACGDYFAACGKPGRIETAAISGMEVAERIIRDIF